MLVDFRRLTEELYSVEIESITESKRITNNPILSISHYCHREHLSLFHGALCNEYKEEPAGLVR